MLKNIKIENFGSYQSFNGFDDKNYFKKLNILYGENYSGKTTLSKIIAMLKSKEEPRNYSNPKFDLIFENEVIISNNNYLENTKNLLVFNKNFIEENLSFLVFNNHTSGSIKSFDAVIVGQDQILINSKINDLNASLNIISQAENRVLSEIDKINTQERIVNNNISNIKVETDRNLTDKAREFEAKGLKNTNRTYRKPNLESDILKIIEKNPNLKLSLTDDEIEKKLKDINVTQKPIINFGDKSEDIKKSFIDHIEKAKIKLNEIAEKKITKEISEFFNDWCIQGFNLHKNHDKDECQFCGNQLKEATLKEYESFLNGKDEVLKSEVNSLLDNHKKMIRAFNLEVDRLVDPNIFFYDSFKSKYEELSDNLKSKAFDFLDNMSKIEVLLEKKIEDTSVSLYYDFLVIKESFNKLLLAYDQVVKICNKNDLFSNDIENEQSKLKAEVLDDLIVRFLIGYGWYSKNNDIKKYESDILLLNEPKLINNQRIIEITNFKLNIFKNIEYLNSQKSSKIAASKLVNIFLNSFFGHESLSIIPLEGDDGAGKFKIVRNEHDAYNLSEGECTLVAFCYFISLVHNLKLTGMLNESIIYIDDPISSLDSSNIFYIYSLIDTVICKGNEYKQLFISTHNLEFFKYLRKLQIPVIQNTIKSCSNPACGETKRNKQENIGFYFIRKINNISTISTLPNYLRKYNTEFNYLFSQIFNCANTETELNPDQIYNFSNNLRKFFEVYNYFKYPSDHNKSVFREKFFDAENNLNHFKLVDRIVNEYSHTEEIFDRTMRPINSQEMIEAAKFVLIRLKSSDEVQYNALIQSTADLRD